MNYQQYFDDDSQEATPRQRSLRERPSTRKPNLSEKRGRVNLKSKFLEDFDPEQSSRERRKLSRKNYNGPSNRSTGLFDERGRYRTNAANVCDCLDESCVGCHFPCPVCKSNKCASPCRFVVLGILKKNI